MFDFIVCLRCLILMLVVVIGSTFGFYSLSSMFDFDVSCCDWKHFWILLFVFDV